MALRPAHDVYHRLRWDPAIDETTADVVVLDRTRGRVSVPFVAFDPRGEIPWSRVVAFLLDGRLVWDRDARVDRVFGTGISPTESLASVAPALVDGSVSVVTLNVLFDRYDEEIVRTELRTPKLLALLEQLDADLVALQEVEPWLCERLRDEGVIGRYHATDDGSGSTTEPYGQLLLSRFPILGYQLVPLGGDKRHLIASVALPGGRTTVAVVHLSSDRHDDAPQRRARQLAVLRARLGPGPALVLGDVNQDEPVDLPLDDAWLRCHPDDPGYTWDPSRNVLASMISRSGARRRIDRVLVRGFDVERIELAAVDRSDVPLSDHHGLFATLQPTTRAEAWGIPLPPHVARALEPLRRRFDPVRQRWPPPLTLAIDESAEPRATLHSQLPTMLELSSTEVLAGPPRRLVVRPSDASARELAALREALGLTSTRPPHVTVATGDAIPTDALRRALPLPLRFPVTRLERWIREDDGRIRTVESRGAASTRPTWSEILDLHGLSAIPAEDPQPLLETIARATRGRACLVGSARLGAQLPEGDFDVVVRHPVPATAHAALRRLGGATTAGAIDVTRLSIELGSPPLPRRVDVSVILEDEEGPEPTWEALASRLAGPGATVLRALKGWTVARQVHDPAWGFVPGLALARAVDQGDRGEPSAWFLSALEHLGTMARALADGSAALPSDVRFVVLPAVAHTLVEEVERALIHGWDNQWDEVFANVGTGEGSGLHIDVRGPPTVHGAWVGWLRGRIATVLSVIQDGSGPQVRIRPYPHPVQRRDDGLRFTVRWTHADASAVTRAVAELFDRSSSSRHRPKQGELDVNVIEA